MLQVALLCFLVGSAHSFSLFENIWDRNEESSEMNADDGGSVGRLFALGPKGNTTKQDDLSISALLEKANINLGKRPTDPMIRDFDIAVGYGLQNADPCTARGCKWRKARDGKVYVPFRISSQYSPNERARIEEGLRSFAERTCVRFIPRTRQRNFVDIISDNGCYSYVGQQRGLQVVSLQRPFCLEKKIVQHEMIHALGFHHEHSRSDRDQHVRILLENVIPGLERNFDKVQTNNLNTPYDYNSVMQYGSTAGSSNGQPTIVPIPDPNVEIGMATDLSNNDILRINRLYNCGREFEEGIMME